jgi:hypothetical protein
MTGHRAEGEVVSGRPRAEIAVRVHADTRAQTAARRERCNSCNGIAFEVMPRVWHLWRIACSS